MNLREFTEAVDKLAEEMTQEELRVFLHSFARKVSEQQRREFVEILEMVKAYQNSEKEEGSFVSKTEKQDKAEIEKEYTRLKELFEEIEEGELYIDAEGYEDYSSGYWDSDWVYEYEDTQGVGQIFEDAANLLLQSVNDKCYETAVDLFALLSEAEVLVVDQGDNFTLSLG